MKNAHVFTLEITRVKRALATKLYLDYRPVQVCWSPKSLLFFLHFQIAHHIVLLCNNYCHDHS